MSNGLEDIITELNRLSIGHKVGQLQKLRSEMHGIQQKRRGIALGIPKKDDPSYAFHWGGRKELQFNIGVEDCSIIRYGVAFSFQASGWYRFGELRDALLPRIERFNEFLRANPNRYRSMRMWGNINDRWVEMDTPSTVQLVPIDGTFVFLGKTQPREKLDSVKVLNTLDELLPLYEFVESDGASSIIPLQGRRTSFPV